MSSEQQRDDDLDLVWRALPQPVGLRLEAQRLTDWSGGPVFAAVDAAGSRHLLVALADSGNSRQPRPTRGLRVNMRRLQIAGGDERNWLDLSCADESYHRTFTAFAQDLLATLTEADTADGGLIASIVDRWRHFWSVPRDGLSREDQLGLIGELWVLTQWISNLTDTAIRSWVGPLGGRHDFANPRLSVEVKTSGAATGPTVHQIKSLDQLSPPVSGDLLLLSLRFVPDPIGEVTLDLLVAEAQRAAGDLSADEINRRLAAAGWSPADRGRYPQRWRLIHQHLYEVTGEFPRLTADSFRGGLPQGITDVGYSLDMSACGAWRIEDSPAVGSRLMDLTR